MADEVADAVSDVVETAARIKQSPHRLNARLELFGHGCRMVIGRIRPGRD